MPALSVWMTHRIEWDYLGHLSYCSEADWMNTFYSLSGTASGTNSPSSISNSENASTIKTESDLASSPYAGQTVVPGSQVK